MTVDNISPPGAWAEELKAAPWGYGQSQLKKVEMAIYNLRKANMWDEARVIEMEINALKTELESLRNARG
jgi:hypothetical protein